VNAETEEASWPKPFCELICAHLGCPVAQYETALFRAALSRHCYPLARWLFWRKPSFFREDLDLIRELAFVRSNDIFFSELNRFYGRNLRDKNPWRKGFGIRLSGKRLIRLKNAALASSE
jgi:hypothetical protein